MKLIRLSMAIAMLCAAGAMCRGAAAAVDSAMGDWQGLGKSAEGVATKVVAQVIALEHGEYRVNLLGDFDRRVRPLAVLTGKREGDRIALQPVLGMGNPANRWQGEISGGLFKGTIAGLQKGTFELKKIVRASPTLGQKAPRGATVLFDGSSLSEWHHPAPGGGKPASWKVLAGGSVEVAPSGGSLVTKRAFGDFRLHLEFRTPFLRGKAGEGRGNSGVYILGRYEVQILDSYGTEGRNNDCGSLYKFAAPRVNMCSPPLQWQTYDITFKAPRFDAGGKKTASARVTVIHNGVTVHDNLELPRPTGAAGKKPEIASGNLVLQDHANPVQFRNIWVVEE
jgi:hypothetical protein